MRRVLQQESLLGTAHQKTPHLWIFLIINRKSLPNLVSEPDSERVANKFDDKKTDKNAENGHLTESFYKAHTHPPEDKTNQESREVTVPYC